MIIPDLIRFTSELFAEAFRLAVIPQDMATFFAGIAIA